MSRRSRRRTATNPRSAKSDAEKVPASRRWADWLIGTIELADGNAEKGLASLLRAEAAEPHLPNLHLRLGETYLRCKRVEDASRAFQRALEIDGDSPEAHVGLSMVYLRQRRFEEAASEALMAVGLQHFSPLGHFNLGIALAVWDNGSARAWHLRHRSRSFPVWGQRIAG